MAKSSTLNPAELNIVFGDIILGGFPKGDALSITFNEDGFAEVVGVDGEHARIMLNDNSATVVVTLLQTSLTNTKLSRAYTEDRKTGRNRKDITIKDARGDTDLKGSKAYIKKMVDGSWGNEVKVRAWTIYVPDLNGIIGGNPDE